MLRRNRGGIISGFRNLSNEPVDRRTGIGAALRTKNPVAGDFDGKKPDQFSLRRKLRFNHLLSNGYRFISGLFLDLPDLPGLPRGQRLLVTLTGLGIAVKDAGITAALAAFIRLGFAWRRRPHIVMRVGRHGSVRIQSRKAGGNA